MPEISRGTITANDIEFAFLECGAGPLALCLHGYPDTAHTYRHLLPDLAAAGFRAVAPFNRGYAPTSLAPDGAYECGALGSDADALHAALGADSSAVVIGHDWGALGAYSAASLQPGNWRRVVAMAVPPGPVAAAGYLEVDQLKLSWYLFFQLHPLADLVVPADDHAYIARLWADWSPGYDGSTDVAHFIEAIPDPDRLSAALNYYRHTLNPALQSPRYAAAQAASLAIPPQPLLYLHGTDDGCMSATIAARTADHLRDDGSACELVEDAGHFLHLEKPAVVNRRIVEFLSA